MTVDEIRQVASYLRGHAIPPVYPAQRNHRCCKGFRVEEKHSPYCYTLKGYYVLCGKPKGPAGSKNPGPHRQPEE